MTDLDVMKEIEAIVNLKFVKLAQRNFFANGYILNPKGRITDLYFFNWPLNLLQIRSQLLQLKRLTTLSVFNLQIFDILHMDISPLKDLKNLTGLFCNGTCIEDISPLKKLKRLTVLSLMQNRIRDISPLKDLKRLETIDLSFNQIEELPAWITKLDLNIGFLVNGAAGWINLYENPIQTPPLEVVMQGKPAIENYFLQKNNRARSLGLR